MRGLAWVRAWVWVRACACARLCARQAHDVEAVRSLPRIWLVSAVHETEVVLTRDWAWYTELVGGEAEHGDSVGVLIRESPMSDELQVEELLDSSHLQHQPSHRRSLQEHRRTMQSYKDEH